MKTSTLNFAPIVDKNEYNNNYYFGIIIVIPFKLSHFM